MLADGTPVIIRDAPESNLLKWVVLLLAALVFAYAGVLAWQVLVVEPRGRVHPSGTIEPTPGAAEAAAMPEAQSQPSVVDPPSGEATQEATPEATRKIRRRRLRKAPKPPKLGATPPADVDIDIERAHPNERDANGSHSGIAPAF